MKEITKLMMNEWKMQSMDWMGYTLEKGEYFSYHHLRVPKREGGSADVYNGAILIQSAGHDYLHTIERCDREMFEYITQILIEINEQRYMPTKEQLIRIRDALQTFENEWQGKRTSKGKLIVKQRYLRRVYK